VSENFNLPTVKPVLSDLQWVQWKTVK